MQTSFPYFDIIIFGVIAVFLILRLKNILGTKTDIDDQNINREQSSKKKFTNIVPLRKNVNETSSIEIQKILKIDPQFNVDDFLAGSETFFKMVLECFVNGNIDNIEEYTKPSVLKSFKNAINDRIQEKEIEIIELSSIKKHEILSVNLTKTSIKIKVLFETFQIRALMDKDKKIIDGDKDNEILVKDEWVFERKISTNNQNWILIETKSI
ncbi:Tim44/TimA family putative adaptor protein [Alphaproteobacteria bacterium]|jgi:predicted lipid-binding transport protein (Tim44 family)|nr:Tim44/TimA family putative adaptor protein [Alphaproteobacteria bacterium]